MSTQLPADFAQYLTIDNAAERFDEARWVAARIEPSGVALTSAASDQIP